MGRFTQHIAALSTGQRMRLGAALQAIEGSSGVRLVAYVVPRANAMVDAASLRAHARSELPEYMVPSIFVRLDALPAGPSGKVDRQALPDPGAASPSRRESERPRGTIEETLATVWCHVLSLPSVGRDDDFFADLGGHSLLAARLLAAVREKIGIPLPLRVLFEHSSIARLATAIESAAGTTAPPEPAISRRPRDAHRTTRDEWDAQSKR